MIFQNSEVEIRDGVGALGTAVDDAVDHELPPESAKVMRNIVVRTHLDVYRRELLGDPPARVEPVPVWLQPGARDVRATPRASPIVHIAGDENCWAYLLSRSMTQLESPVCADAIDKYTKSPSAGSDKFPTKEVVRGRRVGEHC